MTLSVSIGGVAMNDAASHFVDEGSPLHVNALGQRDTFTCRIMSPDGSYKPEIGASVEVSDDAGVRFGGSIRELNVSQFGAALISEIQCASWEQIFDRRYFGETKTFTDTPAGDVFSYVFTNWLTFEDLTSSVVASGPSITITLDWCTVREAFDAIAALASGDTDTYLWDCTAAKVTRFYKQSSFAAPINCTDSEVTVMRPITVNQSFGGSGVGYANKAWVRVGRFVTDERTNTYSPDGTLDSFAFELPLAHEPTVTLSGVVQTIGIRDVDTGKQCYWQDGSPDVTFATPPPSGTNTLTIAGQGYQTTIIDAGQIDDEVTARSIAEDNSGWYQVLIDLADAGTSAEAVAKGQAELAKRGKIPHAVEYVTTTNGIKAGMHQTVNLSAFGIYSVFVIESCTLFQAGPDYGFRVRAVSGALAAGWLQKLRAIATGSASPAASGGGSVVVAGNPLAITAALPNGIVGVAYAGPLIATGGKTPYTFSIASGSLPAWATLDTALGVISGTPTAAATATFTARVTDADGSVKDCDVSIVTVAASDATVIPPSNPTIVSVEADAQPTTGSATRGTRHTTAKRGITIKYTAPDPVGTFLGVLVQIEAPDQSATDTRPLDGSVSLDGSRSLGGPKDPISFGPFAYAETGNSLRVQIPEPDASLLPMGCRARLIPYSDTVTNDASTGPTATFTVPDPSSSKPDSGTAYAPNPLSVLIPATVPGSGVRGSAQSNPYRVTVSGVDETHLWVTVMQDARAAGYVLQVFSPAGELINATGIEASNHFELVFNTPAAIGDYRVYALGSDGTNINPLIDDITPYATVTLGTTDGTVNLGAATPASMGLGLGADGVTLNVKIAGPLYEDVSGNVNLKIAPDFVVSGGQLTQNIVDLAKAANFGTEFAVSGGAFVVNAIAVNKLVAGTALFAGDAIFARSGGGKVTINSAGVAIADNLTTPTATVTATSTGVTVAKGTNNVQVDANGVGINGPSGTLTATSSGVVIANGSSSVTVSASAVTIVNGSLSSPTITGGSLSGASLTITSGTVTLNVDSSNFVKLVDSSISRKIQFMSGVAVRVGASNDSFYNQLDTTQVKILDSTGYTGEYRYNNIFFRDNSGTLLAQYGAFATFIGGAQVLTNRQTGPGSPSFASLANVQTWCQNLLTALQAHGLIS